MAGRNTFDTTQFFIVLALALVAFQIGTVVYAQYTDGEAIKLGWTFFLLTAITVIVSLFVLGKRIDSLSSKEIIFMALEIGAALAIFYYLPKYIPEIFSSQSIEFSTSLREFLSSITRLTPVGVVG